MFAVYQLIFFLALGLLAIAIMVFVLAVSLLGRAVQMAIEDQEKTNKEHKEADEKEMEEIQGELNQATAEDRHPDIKRLDKALEGLKRKKWINKWKLKWINTKPKLLGSVWGALIPGAFFLTSIIVSIIALYTGGGTPEVFPYMWIAIATLGAGICFVCLSLRVIEGVARTSEKIAFKRDIDIFKTSLRKFEEEKKPGLILTFYKEGPPFHTKVGSELEIEYVMELVKGDFAEKARATFFVPKEFSFPGREVTIQPEDHPKVPGYIASAHEFEETILSGVRLLVSITIKVPSEAGNYEVYYRVLCREFNGKYEKFEIIVV